MRVVVFGSTGRVGGLVVEEALRRGHEVTAFARSTATLGDLASRVRAVEGDALDPAAVSQALAGQDAVVYTLGAGNVRQTTLFSDSTRILLAEMARHGVKRLIAVTGIGAGETKGHGGFLYDRILFPLFTKGIYADKDRQEALIRDSGIDWTLVRPASFRARTPPGTLRVVTDVEGVVLRTISPPEVATFIADELDQNQHVRQGVFMGHG